MTTLKRTYQIVTTGYHGINFSVLETRVDEKMKEGWWPIGSPTIIESDQREYLVQAMIRSPDIMNSDTFNRLNKE